MTQGEPPEHALAMMVDALQALASHQALRRRPTLQLRPAPIETWDLAADAVPLDLTAHPKLRAALAKLGPLPLHHGTKIELSDVYIRGLCRALELDYEELRKHL